jgi:hypothetical protein
LKFQNQQAKFNETNGTNYPWVKGIQVCSNKEPLPGPLQRENNYKNAKNRVGVI